MKRGNLSGRASAPGRFRQGTSLDTQRQFGVMNMGMAFMRAVYVKSEIRKGDELRVTDVQGVTEFRNLALGVLGHVDHGKTALVRALTGIETDRLPEERERGLSIVAGYSHMPFSDGYVDLIDVPGHSAFIRAMIGGASGLDGAVLVVGANEGIQPQTREHLDVATLLGLHCGIVALNKCDLVDAPTLEKRQAELKELLNGTFLQDAPIVPVSAITGESIDTLRDLIGGLPRRTPKPPTAAFRLPIDRVFSKPGFGTVVTGTVHTGVASVGDAVMIAPGGKPATIRGIQVHNEAAESVQRGERAAINLRGVDADDVERGMAIVQPQTVSSSRRIDATIEVLPGADAALKNGVALRLLVGTAETQAKLRLLDCDEIVPGKQGLAQLRCDREITSARGMRFILRQNSPAETVGGGIVIEPNAARRRRFDQDAIDRLHRLAAGGQQELLKDRIQQADIVGIAAASLAEEEHLSVADLQALAQSLDAVMIAGHRLYAKSALARLTESVLETVRQFHVDQSFRSGVSLSELNSAMELPPDAACMPWILNNLVAAGELGNTGNAWHLTGFDPLAGLGDAQRKLILRIEASVRDAGIEAPTFDQLTAQSSMASESLQLLLDSGRIVRLQTSDRNLHRALHASTLEQVCDAIQTRYPYPNTFALKDVRDLLQSTRRFVVPLMEHLDAAGFTIRKGDLRHIRQ